MVSDEIATPDDLNSALFAERARLVRLCASLTGAPSAAEDLAQETLLEAWRSWAKLADRQALAPWLSGIARNVCRRWRRRRGREAMYMMREALDDAAAQPATSLDDDGDPTIELERHELAALLDRALALLPPETRLALVQHYIESPRMRPSRRAWGSARAPLRYGCIVGSWRSAMAIVVLVGAIRCSHRPHRRSLCWSAQYAGAHRYVGCKGFRQGQYSICKGRRTTSARYPHCV